MDYTQVITVFAVMVANLGTVIALYINLDKKLDENRKETYELIEAIRQEIRAMHVEIKDFHGRLCAIEERNKK